MARDLARRYRDLELGLADASLVVLADRHGTDRIAGFDERAFRAMTVGSSGESRRLLGRCANAMRLCSLAGM